MTTVVKAETQCVRSLLGFIRLPECTTEVNNNSTSPSLDPGDTPLEMDTVRHLNALQYHAHLHLTDKLLILRTASTQSATNICPSFCAVLEMSHHILNDDSSFGAGPGWAVPDPGLATSSPHDRP